MDETEARLREAAARLTDDPDELDAIVASALATRDWRLRLAEPDYSKSKRCPSCGETKPASAFGANRNRPDGLAHYCRECRRKP